MRWDREPFSIASFVFNVLRVRFLESLVDPESCIAAKSAGLPAPDGKRR